MGFIANFIHFPELQKFWKSVTIWQSYKELKGGNFFETQCTFSRWTEWILAMTIIVPGIIIIIVVIIIVITVTTVNIRWRGGAIGRSSPHQICDLQVAGSSHGWAPSRSGFGQAAYTSVPLSPSSIIWYRPRAVISSCWESNRGPGGK